MTGVCLINPVSDGASLQRSSNDVVEVDLADEFSVEEDTEGVLSS